MPTFLKKRYLISFAVILYIFSMTYLFVRGRYYSFTVNMSDWGYESQVTSIELDPQSKDIIELKKATVDKKGRANITAKAKKPGKAVVHIKNEEDITIDEKLYVHPLMFITCGRYFGDCNGTRFLTLIWEIYFAIIILKFIIMFLIRYRDNMYQYRNIQYLGLIIFMIYEFISLLYGVVYGGGLDDVIFNFLNAISLFVLGTLPLVIIITLVVIASNIWLIRKEGRTWRNMLGFILGLGINLGAIFSIFVERIMKETIITSHFRNSFLAAFLYLFVVNTCYIIVVYGECILLATIIMGIVAARRVPKYDKDYIIILGCQIRKDGTLTRLLKGRADRAIVFAKIQKANTGKDIVFVPSGGQGADEIMPEGEAIKNYLVESGIDEKKIIVENKSVSTDTNLNYSVELIKKDTKKESPKIAFSTTNYHVLRAGMIATSQGIKAEGIGSYTVSYFWINAFIREFIATLVSEKKQNAIVGMSLICMNILIALLLCISIRLLS